MQIDIINYYVQQRTIIYGPEELEIETTMHIQELTIISPKICLGDHALLKLLS